VELSELVGAWLVTAGVVPPPPGVLVVVTEVDDPPPVGPIKRPGLKQVADTVLVEYRPEYHFFDWFPPLASSPGLGLAE